MMDGDSTLVVATGHAVRMRKEAHPFHVAFGKLKRGMHEIPQHPMHTPV